MNILFLSAWYPYPANNGSKLRIYNLLRGLTQKHAVHLISFTDKPNPDQSQLEEMCASVQAVNWVENQLSGGDRMMAKLSSTPFSFLDTFSDEMVSAINDVLDTQQIDLIIASQIKTASYAPYFRNIPAIFEEVELGVMYEQFAAAESAKSKLRYGLTWRKHQAFMRQLLTHFKAITVASAEEKQLFHNKIAGEHIKSKVVPNGVDVDSYVSDHAVPKPNTLIYTGAFGFYSNYEAMVWFVREVFPRIQKQIPDVTLTITGDHKNLPLPQEDGIVRSGFVDDIRPLIAQSAISIAPLQTGGGTRLKILEAMALKTPVVATSKGAQGLDATSGVECLIKDSAEDFAEAILELLSNAEMRERIVENGFDLVKKTYDWQVILPIIEELVEELVICTKE